MKLLKLACDTGDRKLISQALKVMAMKNLFDRSKRVIEKLAQTSGAMTAEQQAFWLLHGKYLTKIFRNQASSRISDPMLIDDLTNEGVLKALEVLMQKWGDYDVSEPSSAKEFLNYLITSGINQVKNKLSGARQGRVSQGDYMTDDKPGHEYPTSYSRGVPQSTYHAPIASIKDFIDQAIREAGFSSPINTSVEQVDVIINDNMAEIENIYQEEVEKIKARGKVPPTLEKVLIRYKGRLNNARERMYAGFSSLDAPAIGGEEASSDTMADKLESEGQLLSLLGASPFDSPEDSLLNKEVMDIVLPIVYRIPLPFRIVMAVHYGVDPNILQAAGEVDAEINRAATILGMDEEEFLSNMKTKKGKRLAWSSTTRLLEQVYGDKILSGIRNIEGFENTIKSYFKKLVDSEVARSASSF